MVARNGSLHHCRTGGREEPLYIEEEEETRKGEDGASDDSLISGIYLQGLGLLFRHLSTRFQNADEDGEADSASTSSSSSSPLASFDQAQYVQSVLEAVRRSAKQRAWTQVTQKTDADLASKEEAECGKFPPLSPKANLWQKQQMLRRLP